MRCPAMGKQIVPGALGRSRCRWDAGFRGTLMGFRRGLRAQAIDEF